MKNLILSYTRTILSGSLLLFSVALFAQNIVQTIEEVLPGVVTVAVFEMAEEDAAFGFGEKDNKASKSAYEAALDMTGVATSGSGFLVKYKGKPYVITNAHVVDGARNTTGAVGAFSIARKKYPLRLVGGDSFYDLAVLAFEDVEPGDELSYLEFASEPPRLTEDVFAIGNPLGLYPYSITDGIVSGKNRLFQNPSTGKYGYLQHTATLIWGNSGGPLVNKQGKVVGVNAWIGTRTNESQQYIFSQLNFAIEIEVVQRVLKDIVENKGRVRRASMGVEFATRLDYTGAESNPFINGLLSGSSAEEVLSDHVGSYIRKINNEKVVTLQDVVRIMEGIRPNTTITLGVEKPRDDGFPGKIKTVSLTTEELSVKKLENISQYFFHRYTDYEWNEPSLAGLVNKTDKSKPRVEMISAGSGTKTYVATSGESSYSLVGAGLLDNWGRGSLYRIRNARDMGMIIRLCSLEGHLSAAVEGANGGAENIRFFMQDDDFNELRVLFY